MSRIGNTPISVPNGVTVTVASNRVVIHGPKGELGVVIPDGIRVASSDGTLVVRTQTSERHTRALHGLVRAQLANAIEGVTQGCSKTLELSGVGFRAHLQGTNVVLTIGFSHPVTFVPPVGITFQVVEGKIVVSGTDKHLVGQAAATIRSVKPPEPYKGKGIKYAGERIRKKAGKSAKAIGAVGGPR